MTINKNNKLQKYFGAVRACQVCASHDLRVVLRYGNLPIVQAYLRPEELQNPEPTYPLNVIYCDRCGLIQLDYIVDPKLVFPKNYPYRTSLTNMLIRNFRTLADKVIPEYKIKHGDLVIDIGSNDGTLLQGFKEKGMRVLGVEPTDAAKVANKNKILTLQKFFTLDLARQIVKRYGKAKLVTATNVFAHINNAPNLSKAVSALLADDGVFISESQYFADTFEKLEFDCVYHEHLRFYTLKPLIYLHKLGGMTVVDAERIGAAGGSIRVYATKKKQAQKTSINVLVAAEEKLGLYNLKTLRDFAARAAKAKRDIVMLVLECKKRGCVIGLGSPARSNTLLGYTHIDKDMLDYAVEKSGSPKIGLLTPGTHIPVFGEKQLLEEQPEYALVLSWHIGEELMKLMRKLGYKGKFIMPLPTPRVIDNL